jgi:lauroyl/myristoyl acyltransferase
MSRAQPPVQGVRELLGHPRDLARWGFWVPFRDALDPHRPEQLRRLWPLWRLAHRAGGAQRGRMERELRQVLGPAPDTQLHRLVRECYRVSFRVHLEELLMGKLCAETVDNFLELRGEDRLQRALARGRGAIMLSAHAGSFMLPIASLSLKGYPYTQYAARGLPPEELAEAHPEALPTNRWQRRVIEVKESHEDRLPARFITLRTPTREIFRRLGRNELVALAFDGRMGNRWVRSPFLGRQALLNPGAYRLAATTGAAIIPTLCRTPADGPSICQLGEPILPESKDWRPLMRRFITEQADPWLREHLADYGTWLAHCRVRAAVDDHPLFVDYAVDRGWERFPEL